MVTSSTQQGLQQVYGAQGTPIPGVFQPPVIATRDPTSSDYNFKVGRQWVNKSTPSMWFLGAKASGSATWIAAGSGATGGVVTVTGDSGGARSPTAGNMNLLGTANQIGVAGSGSTLTWSLPSAITTPGSLTTTTSLTATTTVTAGTGITATTGNIVASAGNISSTAGSVSAGTSVAATTTVTGGTGVIATTGGVTATAGDITATAGNIIVNGAAKQFRCHGGAVTDFIGQVTLTSGTADVLNTNIAATDRVFLTRSAKNGSTAYGAPLVTITAATKFNVTACKSDTTTETNDASTFDYFIVRQV